MSLTQKHIIFLFDLKLDLIENIHSNLESSCLLLTSSKMITKRNQTVVIGLCIALAISLVIIFVLVYRGKQTKEKLPRGHFPPYPIHPPPQKLPQPQHEAKKKPTLVLFYANGCGHCKNMMGEWEKVKRELMSSGECDVVSLEAGAHQNEMQMHKIVGFPEIRLYLDGFPNGPHISYRGNRSAESFLNFVRSGGKAV